MDSFDLMNPLNPCVVLLVLYFSDTIGTFVDMLNLIFDTTS